MTVHNLLVAYDGTQPSKRALAESVEIVKATGAKMTLVCVIPVIASAYGIEMPPGESVAETIAAVRSMLANEKLALQQLGVAQVETVLLEGNPVDRILEYAEKHPTDLIVTGSRGLSEAGRFFLGSVSDGLLHHARCSILISKSNAPPRSGGSRAL
jgi:nucleotide-binding universal stress UspA family protein